MKLNEPAKKFWEKIPNQVRVKLLNNVYCTSCKAMVGIGNAVGKMDGPDLILQGVCVTCGGQVARVVEGT